MKTLNGIISAALLMFLLIPSNSFSDDKVYFNADYAIFRGTDSKSTVEIYFSFTQRGLTYFAKDNQYEGFANVDISIFDKEKNTEIFKETYGLQSVVSDTTRNKLTSKIIGQQNFLLSTGIYVIKLSGYDRNNNSSVSSDSFEVSLPEYSADSSCISDIQLATRIIKSTDKNSIFYKNGLEITPNPNLLFGFNLNTLHYYMEVYNLKKQFPSDGIYLYSRVKDVSGNILMEKEKLITSKSEAIAEIGSFNLDSLLSQAYFLEIEIIDKANSYKIIKEKKFYVYNADKFQEITPVEDQKYMQSEFITLTEEQLDDEFDKVIYIRTTYEKNEYEKLKTEDDKRKFMYYFWKRRDDKPATLNVEAREDYFKRLNEANRLYKQSFTEGWKTDRGRIYLIYGRPSDVERHFFESDVKNYEIWTYDNVEGGTICVFAETSTSGSGFYYLVHSTMRKEFRDPDWLRKLKK